MFQSIALVTVLNMSAPNAPAAYVSVRLLLFVLLCVDLDLDLDLDLDVDLLEALEVAADLEALMNGKSNAGELCMLSCEVSPFPLLGPVTLVDVWCTCTILGGVAIVSEFTGTTLGVSGTDPLLLFDLSMQGGLPA